MANVETRRQLVAGSTLGAAALLAIALVGILNYLAFRHYERWDWTSSRLYTLSEKTTNILGALDEEIEAVVFMDPASELYPAVQELLARYAAASPNVTVRTVDPARNPAEAQRLIERYDIQRAEVVVFVGPDDRRVVESSDLADYDYTALQAGGAPEMTGFKGEQLFTEAILSLAERRKPHVLFTTGHGEASLDDTGARGLFRLQDILGRDNFEIEEWSSLGKADVPQDADLVVVAGPTAPFAEPELAAFGRYLDDGGRMLVLLEPDLGGPQADEDRLATWLGGYGVTSPAAVVVDPSRILPFYGAETIYADAFGNHPITEALRQAGVPVVFSMARPVDAAAEDGGATVLVRTTAEGRGETSIGAGGEIARDADDIAGPVGLGVAVELPAVARAPEAPAEEPASDGAAVPPPTPPGDAPGGRLVVYGDADFVTNASLGQSGNAILAANTMNWLVERPSHLGIPPKEPDQVRLSLAPDQRRLVFWLVVLILPGACLAAGIWVNWRRRR